jgi:hypothetical protein
VLVDGTTTALQAHEAAVAAEHALLHALPRLKSALVHADPQVAPASTRTQCWPPTAEKQTGPARSFSPAIARTAEPGDPQRGSDFNRPVDKGSAFSRRRQEPPAFLAPARLDGHGSRRCARSPPFPVWLAVLWRLSQANRGQRGSQGSPATGSWWPLGARAARC